MLLNKLLVLIFSVKSLAYKRQIHELENILDNTDNSFLINVGAHEQIHRTAGYKKDNLTDILKGTYED